MSELVTHAYSMPFRVQELESFMENTRRFVGVTVQVLDAQRATVRLTADGGTWEVYEVIDGALGPDIVDLDDLVVAYLQPGEVAVFSWTRVHNDTIDAGLYAVNSAGESHGDSLNSTAQRALAALGAPETASVNEYLENPEATSAI